MTSGVAHRPGAGLARFGWRTGLAWLARATEMGASVLLALLACVVILQVASRYILRAPLDWTVDGATALMIWLSFAGAALAAFERAHFVIDSVVDLLPVRPKRFVIAFGNACAVVVLCTVVIFGWRFAMLQMGQDYPALPLSKGWVALAIPIGAGLMIPRYLADAITGLIDRQGNDLFDPEGS